MYLYSCCIVRYKCSSFREREREREREQGKELFFAFQLDSWLTYI